MYTYPVGGPTPRDTIIHGDCTQVLRTLPNEFVDLVLVDPPYFVRYTDRYGRTIANDSDPNSVLGAFNDLYRVLKPNTFCISFYGWNSIDSFFSAWRSAGFTPVGHLVWHKRYASSCKFLQARHEQAYLLAKGRPAKPAHPIQDVLPWEYTGNHRHPTEKSPNILRPLIESFCAPGALVLDAFAGSGSALIAAAAAGRHYLGVELEAKYCELICQRLGAMGAPVHASSFSLAQSSDELREWRQWLHEHNVNVPEHLFASLHSH